MNFLGKAMLAGSLCLQAYILLTDNQSASQFKGNAADIIKDCPHLSVI